MKSFFENLLIFEIRFGCQKAKCFHFHILSDLIEFMIFLLFLIIIKIEINNLFLSEIFYENRRKNHQPRDREGITSTPYLKSRVRNNLFDVKSSGFFYFYFTLLLLF